MDSNAMNSSTELRIGHDDWSRLQQHLFPGDGDEHGAALLCGVATTAYSVKLVVRDVVLAKDGIDYVAGGRGHRHLNGEFVTRNVRRAHDDQLAYLAVHNHGGRERVAFSATDMASHERGYPTLTSITGNPVGGIVCTQDAIAGDLWWPDGSRQQLSRAVVLGAARATLRDRPDEPPRHIPGYDRQTLLFGARGQDILAGTTVGIVGLGGIGMLLAVLLGRLGVGRFILIDPDRVESSNLPRLPDATRRDAATWADAAWIPTSARPLLRRLATPKVNLAKRVIRRANRAAHVTALHADVADDEVARRLLEVDYIFLAADTAMARSVVNQLAYQYLIPTLQVGSKIVPDPSTGSVMDVYAVVRHLGLTAGCLLCNGLIDTAELTETSIGDTEQRHRQRYVDDENVHAPSVITLNGRAAAAAADEFMLHTVGLGGAEPAHRLYRTRTIANGGHVTIQVPDASPHCPACGGDSTSNRARGDARDLPTRTRG